MFWKARVLDRACDYRHRKDAKRKLNSRCPIDSAKGLVCCDPARELLNAKFSEFFVLLDRAQCGYGLEVLQAIELPNVFRIAWARSRTKINCETESVSVPVFACDRITMPNVGALNSRPVLPQALILAIDYLLRDIS